MGGPPTHTQHKSPCRKKVYKINGYWMNSVGQTVLASNVELIHLSISQSTFYHGHFQQETTLANVQIDIYDIEHIYFSGICNKRSHQLESWHFCLQSSTTLQHQQLDNDSEHTHPFTEVAVRPQQWGRYFTGWLNVKHPLGDSTHYQIW